MKLEDLVHKKKTVPDLIRYIANRAEDPKEKNTITTPNYSILLGSGASVTSGIRSGQSLINFWKKEVYEECKESNKLGIDEFFSSKNAPEWYEESNAYSSLFENRYDLQRHRRIFVEHEVSGKTPSLGYAYLVKLIEKGFFNTVFTTNFDDLLNEAFYRFSKNRPIVCAHDSSISGITVTSARPKIIKLHGDYLFDNIKTTLKETESLEMNMKMKFQEFAKDFGLIVVGYAGHDRSIMDILTYLLQQEDYFKNGIYWCIRKGDISNISPELKRLLWRDRVYYVEIDGFDEFFAELNHSLNNGALPIDDAFLSRSHQESIIKDLTENSFIRSGCSSKYLLEDCEKLKAHFENNLTNDFFKYVREKKSENIITNNYRGAKRKLKYPKMTKEELNTLYNLQNEAFISGHINSVLQKLHDINVFLLKDSRYKLELLELEADLTENMSDDLVKKYFDELIELDPENERYYEIAAIRSNDINQSLTYLNLATEKFVNDYQIINSYIEKLLEYCDNYCFNNDLKEVLEKIDSKINRSLSLYPYINNESYSYRLEYYELLYKNDIEHLRQNKTQLCDEIYKMSCYHPQTLYILREAKSTKLNKETFECSLRFYKSAYNDRYVEKVYLELIKWKEENSNFNDVINLFKKFEEEYNYSYEYKLLKATLLMKYEYFNDAWYLLDSVKEENIVIMRKMIILSILNKKEELYALYNKHSFNNEYKLKYYNLTLQYDKLKEYYEDLIKNNKVLSSDELIDYAFTLLKLKQYNSVVSLLSPYYQKPNLVDGVIIINYLLAKKLLGENVAAKVKAKILDNKFIEYDDSIKMGAYCLINDEDNVYNCLHRIIIKDPIFKYSVKSWPVLDPYIKKDKFIKMLEFKSNSL